MLRQQLIKGPPSCLNGPRKQLVRSSLRTTSARQHSCHQQQEALGWQASTARVEARLQSTLRRTQSAQKAQTWPDRISQAVLGALLSAVLAFTNTAPARPATAYNTANVQQLQETLVQSWGGCQADAMSQTTRCELTDVMSGAWLRRLASGKTPCIAIFRPCNSDCHAQ